MEKKGERTFMKRQSSGLRMYSNNEEETKERNKEVFRR